ncbi:MAG: TIGR00341 family protein [Methylococcales bacterium]|nr:TIGR00341 family protein [Methylococcales bacterium]
MRHSLTDEQKEQIYETISQGSEPRLSFYILVILSTIIAAYGLIANSTAVVIGAMIVAPLMTPIVGMALSLVSGDGHLFRAATISEIVGVICSIGLGYLAGDVTFGVELSSEILARTQPLPYDILVAIAAGLAGAYSLVNPRINAALAGVAIAVSLVPPLAATGICLSLARYDLALGAFLLFFANFLAIQLASVFVFISTGFVDYFHHKENELLLTKTTSTWKLVFIFSKRFLPSIILLGLVTFHLSQSLIKLVNKKEFQQQLEATFKEELQKRTGARLTEVNYKTAPDGKINTIAVVMTPQEFTPIEIDKIEERVQLALHNENINVVIRSIISKDADKDGAIFLLDEEKLKRLHESEEANFLNDITQALNKSLASFAGAYLNEIRREDNDGIKTIIAIVRTPIAITPTQVKAIETLLQTIDMNIHLVIRSILTRDADGTRYLYQPTEDITLAQQKAELDLRKKLEEVLKTSVRKNVKGGALLDFQYNTSDDTSDVLAVVQTPQNFSNKQVKIIQAQLQNEVDKRIKLVVRSIVGTDMDENGFMIPEESAAISSTNSPVITPPPTALPTPEELTTDATSRQPEQQ